MPSKIRASSFLTKDKECVYALVLFIDFQCMAHTYHWDCSLPKERGQKKSLKGSRATAVGHMPRTVGGHERRAPDRDTCGVKAGGNTATKDARAKRHSHSGLSLLASPLQPALPIQVSYLALPVMLCGDPAHMNWSV
jgi:hypothetical protein